MLLLDQLLQHLHIWSNNSLRPSTFHKQEARRVLHAQLPHRRSGVVELHSVESCTRVSLGHAVESRHDRFARWVWLGVDEDRYQRAIFRSLYGSIVFFAAV